MACFHLILIGMANMRLRVTFWSCIRVTILLAMTLPHVSVANFGKNFRKTLLTHNINLSIRGRRHLRLLTANLPTIMAITIKRVFISGFWGIKIFIHARTVRNAWIVIFIRGITLRRTRVVSLITHRIFCGWGEVLTLVVIFERFIVEKFPALANLTSCNFINFFWRNFWPSLALFDPKAPLSDDVPFKPQNFHSIFFCNIFDESKTPAYWSRRVNGMCVN